MERPYRIYRTGQVGRVLYDTQSTLLAAESSVKTGQAEHRGDVFDIQARYFVSMYTDGPATRWNVIDRKTQEWVRRFSTEQDALDYAAKLETERS